LQVHLAHIDERAMQDGGLSPHATREYLAWSNTLAKLIGRLGLHDAQEQTRPNLTDYLAMRAASGPHTAPGALPHPTEPARIIASCGALRRLK
jgi:hypothetical protein